MVESEDIRKDLIKGYEENKLDFSIFDDEKKQFLNFLEEKDELNEENIDEFKKILEALIDKINANLVGINKINLGFNFDEDPENIYSLSNWNKLFHLFRDILVEEKGLKTSISKYLDKGPLYGYTKTATITSVLFVYDQSYVIINSPVRDFLKNNFKSKFERKLSKIDKLEYYSKNLEITKEIIEELNINERILVTGTYFLSKDNSKNINYWAGGFHWDSQNKFEEFINKGYWKLGWSKDKHPDFYELVKKIDEGDMFALKTYGGTHKLAIYALGKVKDTSRKDEGIIGIKWIEVNKDKLYSGDAPRGKGAGNWQNSIIKVKRKKDIEKIFDIEKISKQVYECLDFSTLDWDKIKEDDEYKKLKQKLNKINKFIKNKGIDKIKFKLSSRYEQFIKQGDKHVGLTGEILSMKICTFPRFRIYPEDGKVEVDFRLCTIFSHNFVKNSVEYSDFKDIFHSFRNSLKDLGWKEPLGAFEDWMLKDYEPKGAYYINKEYDTINFNDFKEEFVETMRLFQKNIKLRKKIEEICNMKVIDNDKTNYFILKLGSDEYEDKPEEQYHFKEGIPGSKQIKDSDKVKFVYCKDNTLFAKGEISKFNKEKIEGETNYFAEIEKYDEFKDKISLPEISENLSVNFPVQYGIIKITEEDYYKIINKKFNQHNIDSLLDKNNATPIFNEISVTDGLYFPEEMKKEINNSVKAALEAGKNIILTGPPGTGKTKIAKNIAKNVTRMNTYVDGFIFTTATADWTTFDTIGGYHPSKDDSSLTFKPGQFLKCFKEEQKPMNKWLIIDEINRADIDKAFGQLFSVLSKDSVELPFTNESKETIKIKSLDDNVSKDDLDYSDCNYYVTKNWRLIATMNTYDKASLYEMSYAFMRRFAFIDVGVPEISDNSVKEYIEACDKWKINLEAVEDYLDGLTNIWQVLNNNKRAIGPAIIKDMLSFLQKYEGKTPIINALKLYVLPQLEGMIKQDQEEIFKELKKKIDKEKLKKVAKERFEINLDKDKNE